MTRVNMYFAYWQVARFRRLVMRSPTASKSDKLMPLKAYAAKLGWPLKCPEAPWS